MFTMSVSIDRLVRRAILHLVQPHILGIPINKTPKVYMYATKNEILHASAWSDSVVIQIKEKRIPMENINSHTLTLLFLTIIGAECQTNNDVRSNTAPHHLEV